MKNTNTHKTGTRPRTGLLALAVLGTLMTLVLFGTALFAEAGFTYEYKDGTCDIFVDEDGDGINDNATGNARDNDEDGIPNGQDDDYEPARDGSGSQESGNGKNSNGSGDGNGEGEKNGGQGKNSGSGSRDGSCTQ